MHTHTRARARVHAHTRAHASAHTCNPAIKGHRKGVMKILHEKGSFKTSLEKTERGIMTKSQSEKTEQACTAEKQKARPQCCFLFKVGIPTVECCTSCLLKSILSRWKKELLADSWRPIIRAARANQNLTNDISREKPEEWPPRLLHKLQRSSGMKD